MESDQEFDVLSFITNMSLANGNDKALRNGTFKFSWFPLNHLPVKPKECISKVKILKRHFVAMMASEKILKKVLTANMKSSVR